MGSSDWILPVLMIGGLGIGAIVLLPRLMKEEGPIAPEDEVITKGEAERIIKELSRRAALQGIKRGKELGEEIPVIQTTPRRLPQTDFSDIIEEVAGGDDAYLITDDDFRRLDIGKSERSFLNRQRKIRDAKLARILYGDSPIPGERPFIVPAYYTNTVSPYGQGPAREFVRLPYAETTSRSNTFKNTLNLY